jgi:hypothetical protein
VKPLGEKMDLKPEEIFAVLGDVDKWRKATLCQIYWEWWEDNISRYQEQIPVIKDWKNKLEDARAKIIGENLDDLRAEVSKRLELDLADIVRSLKDERDYLEVGLQVEIKLYSIRPRHKDLLNSCESQSTTLSFELDRVITMLKDLGVRDDQGDGNC